MTYRVAIMGCGGVSRPHARGYLATHRAQIVAACDPKEEARKGFSEEFGVDATFPDAEGMLDALHPDLVSICTLNPTHAELTILAARKGVRGIVCEKPMAMNLREADAMLEACKQNGVRLIVGHQRRFDWPWVKAKDLLDSGAIGKLLRMEANIETFDLMTWGTHWLDIFRFFNNDEPTDWVFGHVDIHDTLFMFGQTVESAGLAKIRYTNGVEAVYHAGKVGVGTTNLLIGTEGMIEINPCCTEEAGPVRLFNTETKGWQVLRPSKLQPVYDSFEREMFTFFDCLESSEVHPLEGTSAREVMAQIIAVYESSRTRKVIKFPVDIQNNPFFSMLEAEK